MTKMRLIAAMALAAALACSMLAGCGSQDKGETNTSNTGNTSNAVENQASETEEAIDVSSMTTFKDIYAVADDMVASMNDDKHFTAMFKTGDDKYIFAIAELDKDTKAKLDALDISASDYEKKAKEARSELKIETVEDVTGDRLDDEELAGYVGKTGKDLIDDGFTFSSYDMYGGEQTGGNFEKGYFAYEFVFDVSTPESSIEDEGKSVMDAKIVEATCVGTGDTVMSPENIED